VDPSAPRVLVGHVSVSGAELSSLFRVAETEDVVLDDPSFADGFAYVALGHVHKAQALGGRETVRYSGSVERMDLGESADRKGVVAFDLGPGGATNVRTIPLDATPVYDVAIHDPAAELPTLADRFPDHATALVNLHVRYTAGVDSLEGILRELDGVFPRWYARDWTESGELGPSLTAGEASPAKGFAATVRDYLADELANHGDDERNAVLGLADELLAAEAPA
jgi:exonuclease SbcD